MSNGFYERSRAARIPATAPAAWSWTRCARLDAGLAGAVPLAAPRQVSLIEIGDYAGKRQFEGDGTAAHPPLYNRDVLAFLPFQVTPKRFVIPVYVMTTNLAKVYKPSAPLTDPDALRHARRDVPAHDRGRGREAGRRSRPRIR